MIKINIHSCSNVWPVNITVQRGLGDFTYYFGILMSNNVDSPQGKEEHRSLGMSGMVDSRN